MQVSNIPATRDEQLEAALERVATLEEEFEKACVGYADAESEYRVQFAKQYLLAEGTEKARNSEAIVAVERFLRDRDSKEAVKEFTREKLRDAQAAVLARQTLLKSSLDTNRAF